MCDVHKWRYTLGVNDISMIKRCISDKKQDKGIKNTVKLGYNELGYNEHPVITNKLNTLGWYKSF